MRNTVVSVICIVTTILIFCTTPVWVPADVGIYLEMCNGAEVAEPWNSRILIPWIVGLLGGTFEVFVLLNLIMFAVALYVYATVYDVFTALAFVVGTFSVLQIVIQLPLLEAPILLLIALALWVREKGNAYWFIPLCAVAAMTHPVALVIVVLVLITSGYGGWVFPLFAIPGIVVMYVLWPGSGMVLMLPIEIYKTVIMTVGVFWIGLLRIRKDRQGAMVLLVLGSCLCFAMVATYTAKCI